MRHLILFLLGLLLLAPQPLDAQTTLPPSLRERATDALTRRQLDSARLLMEQWLQADPRDQLSWYNMACILALQGETDEAIDAFDNAVRAGWRDAEYPPTDSDLESIHEVGRFKDLIKQIHELQVSDAPRDFKRHFVSMTSRGTYVVMLPPDYDSSNKTYPLCVILHGAGSTELEHGRLADGLGREEVIYIAVRAPYGAFGRAIEDGKPGYTAWPHDRIPEEDGNNVRSLFDDYVNLIFTSVEDARRQYRIRPGKVWIVGHSQGGQFANLCGILQPNRVAGVLSIAGSSVREVFLSESNLQRVKEEGVTYRIIHGDSDQVVPNISSTRLTTTLRAAGIKVEFDIMPGGHTISPALMAAAKKWKESIK